jgi:SAM-dependent methyltransferase
MRIYEHPSEIIQLWQWGDPGLLLQDEIIMKLLSKEPKGKALDLGCGTGRLSMKLATEGWDVDGLDTSQKVIKIAQAISNAKGLGINFFTYDGSEYVKKEFYNLIVCSEVLEHVDDDLKIINNIYESLAPGGMAIITVPHDSKQWSTLDEYGGHKRRYDIKEMRERFSNFEIENLFTHGFPMMRMIIWIYKNLYVKKLGKKFDNETIWSDTSLKSLTRLVYYIGKFDRLFVNLNMGTNVICKVRRI